VVASASIGAFGGAKVSLRKSMHNPSVFYEYYEGPSPYLTYGLAILAGGGAILIPRFGSEVISALVIYGVLALLFSFFWPKEGWQWGLWLCLPLLIMSGYKSLMAGGMSPLATDAQLIVMALPAAGVGAFLGSRLSFRKEKTFKQQPYVPGSRSGTLGLGESLPTPRHSSELHANGHRKTGHEKRKGERDSRQRA
jgi:hypothetical protein